MGSTERYEKLLVDLANIRSPYFGAEPCKNELTENAAFQQSVVYEQYLKANEACSKAIILHENKIQTVIAKLEAQLDSLEKESDNKKKKGRPSQRIGCVYTFGSPYFKDECHFSAISNEVTLEKKRKREINLTDFLPVKNWKSSEKQKLVNAIHRIVADQRIKQFRLKKQMIEQEMIEASDNSNLKRLTEELEKCNELINGIRDLPLETLINEPNKNVEYDWMSISATDLQGEHTPEECRAIWFAYLSPFINKAKFTPNEDEKLKKLADEFHYENWDMIAEKLGTKRSGYQCAVHYQMKLNTCIKKQKWSVEEDMQLVQIVNKLRVGSYIPWAKVVSHMDGRTKVQIFNRYKYSIGPHIKKGRFSKEEDKMIMAAILKYGVNFKQIARFVPNRTPIQIRDRYISHLQRTDPSEPWKQENDVKLLAFVDKFGRKSWSRISKEFPGFSRTQIRHRFLTIQKWKLKYPSVADKAPPVRRMTRRSVFGAENTSDITQKLKNDEDLVKIQEELGLTYKTKVGRKSGQKKMMSLIDQKLMSHFQVVHHHIGGRKKRVFYQEEVEKECEILKHVLMFFKSSLTIPLDVLDKPSSYIDNNDKYYLQYLRDGYLKDDPSLRKKTIGSRAKVMKTKLQLGENSQKEDPDNVTLSKSGKCLSLKTSHLPPINKSEQLRARCDTNIVPINITTAIGIHTLAVCRRTLAKQYRHSDVQDIEKWADAVSSDSSDSDDPENLVVDEIPKSSNNAVNLWLQRFISVFLAPSFLTNVSPERNMILGFKKSASEVENELGSESNNISLNGQAFKTPRRHYQLKRRKKRKINTHIKNDFAAFKNGSCTGDTSSNIDSDLPKRKYKKHCLTDAPRRQSPRFAPAKYDIFPDAEPSTSRMD